MEELSAKIEIDMGSVDKMVRRLQSIDFGLPKGEAKASASGPLGGFMSGMNGIIEKFKAPIEKFQTSQALKGIAGVGEEGAAAAEGGGLMELISGLGEGMLAALGPIAVIAIIAKGIHDSMKPILDLINLVVGVLVLPLSILIQSILRPLLFYFFKFLLFAMGVLKLVAGFITGDAKLQAEGSKEIGDALASRKTAEGAPEKNMNLAALTTDQILGLVFPPLMPLAILSHLFPNIPTPSDILGAIFSKGVDLGAFVLEQLAGLGKWIWDGLTGILTTAWTGITDIGAWIYKTLVATLKVYISGMEDIGAWIYKTLTATMQVYISGMEDIGTWAYNTLTATIGGFIAGMADIGKWIWDTLTKAFTDSFSALVGGVYDLAKLVWDAISKILPGGGNNMVSTYSPSAPQKSGSSGAGGTITIGDIFNRLKHSPGWIKLIKMLREEGYFHCYSSSQLSRSWGNLARKYSHQSALTCTIDADNSNAISRTDIPSQVREQLFIASLYLHIFCLKHRLT